MLDANNLLTIIGLVFALWGTYHLVLGRSSAGWPSVEGRVIRSAVISEQVSDPHGEGLDTIIQFNADILIGYEVAGHRYETRSLRIGDNNMSRYREDAERLVTAYPIGTQVRVHYDPSSPERTTLEPGKTSPAYYIALILGLVLLALRFTGLVP